MISYSLIEASIIDKLTMYVAAADLILSPAFNRAEVVSVARHICSSEKKFDALLKLLVHLV